MRLIDTIRQRYGSTFHESQHSGAYYVNSSYGEDRAATEIPDPNYAVCKQQYQQSGVVFAAILARMMLFSEVKFVFQSKNDGKLDDLPPRAQILENPWAGGTTGDLLSRMLQDVDLAGNSYVWNTGNGGLFRLPPDQVKIVSYVDVDTLGRKHRHLLGYWWDPAMPNMEHPSEDAEFFTAEEIAHWAPIPDPDAQFRGMSWLTPVLKEIGSDQGLTDYKLRYLHHAATPNMVLQYKQRLQKETIDALRERMHARYGGVDNAFKTLILDQGADMTVVGNSLEEMNFATVQAAGENRILMASGVPGIVVGAKEGLQAATYSNYAQAMRRFADLTIRPLWRSVCACLSDTIVNVPADKTLWFDTRNIAALQQDEVEKAQAIQIKSAAIVNLVRNYDPDSVVKAVEANDFSLLEPLKVQPLPAGNAGNSAPQKQPLVPSPSHGTPMLPDTLPGNGKPQLPGPPKVRVPTGRNELMVVTRVNGAGGVMPHANGS